MNSVNSQLDAHNSPRARCRPASEVLKASDDSGEHVSGTAVSELQRNSLPASSSRCGRGKVVVTCSVMTGGRQRDRFGVNAISVTWCTQTNYPVFVQDPQNNLYVQRNYKRRSYFSFWGNVYLSSFQSGITRNISTFTQNIHL